MGLVFITDYYHNDSIASDVQVSCCDIALLYIKEQLPDIPCLFSFNSFNICCYHNLSDKDQKVVAYNQEI